MTLATNTELSLQTLAQSSVTLESGRLAVNSLADAICIAHILTISEMVPKASAKDTMEVAILKNAGKIIAGVGLGLTPFQSVQAFANINGRPCLYGDAMMAIIYASGLLEDYSEEWFPKQSEPRGVKVTMKRKGVATPVSACFSIENAKSAGLLASSPTWQSYTADMLLARARSRCAPSASSSGELVEWTGFATPTASPAAWVFVWWTAANLVPRAHAIHRKYIEEFGAQAVGRRKRIIPYIY